VLFAKLRYANALSLAHKAVNKLFFVAILVCLVAVVFVPLFASAAIVKCDPAGGKACDFNALKQMLTDILNFLVNTIAAPLAILAITIGAILMMTSAGDPNRMSMGKKVLYAAIIGLALAFGTKAIINFILDAVQYTGDKI